MRAGRDRPGVSGAGEATTARGKDP
jgi:hypothetical protein